MNVLAYQSHYPQVCRITTFGDRIPDSEAATQLRAFVCVFDPGGHYLGFLLVQLHLRSQLISCYSKIKGSAVYRQSQEVVRGKQKKEKFRPAEVTFRVLSQSGMVISGVQ